MMNRVNKHGLVKQGIPVGRHAMNRVFIVVVVCSMVGLVFDNYLFDQFAPFPADIFLFDTLDLVVGDLYREDTERTREHKNTKELVGEIDNVHCWIGFVGLAKDILYDNPYKKFSILFMKLPDGRTDGQTDSNRPAPFAPTRA
jgi:hypothetical protein